MTPMIYLAGPMAGLRSVVANGWRDFVAKELSDTVRCLSPMRGILNDIVPMTDENNPVNSAAGALARDRFDIERADMVLANFLGADKASIGTVFELGIADTLRVPVIVVMEKKGNLHDHPFITQPAAFRVDNLPDAIQIVRDVV